MTKKKNNLYLIIPAFLFVGMAIGIQTGNIIKQGIIGVVVGIVAYIILRIRNNKLNKTDS